MKHLIRLLLGVAVAIALIGTVGATGTFGTKAEAATYVSKSYTAPKKGQTNAGVKALQYRLIKAKALGAGNTTGYFGNLTEAGVKKFQRQNKLAANGKVSKTTWNLLVKKTGTIKLGGSSGKSPIPNTCRSKGRVLCIDKTQRKLQYLENGSIKLTTSARFGCAGTATREGTFRVFRKNRYWVSTIYHSPMPYSMFFSGGQAVHYSSDFAARGYAGCSHGCVNLRDWNKIAWIFNHIKVGDKVVVYRS